MAPRRPTEELYDLSADPWETDNVAANPAYTEVLEELRERLNGWLRKTGDKGQYPESEESLETIRDRYRKRLADRLAELGVERVDQLYGAWKRHLKRPRKAKIGSSRGSAIAATAAPGYYSLPGGPA